MEVKITDYTITKLKQLMEFENSLVSGGITIKDLDHALMFAIFYTLDNRKREVKEIEDLNKEIEYLKNQISE